MTEYELGIKLKEMYDNAPKGDSVAHIHLFGIKYADEIRNGNCSPSSIVHAAGLSPSYHAEISKGIKLSKYVIIKGRV